jgi:Zn-finger nucleic acid-binding protein
MTAATARANPGTLIELDQCRQCGGIWCDKWELFPIDPEEAARLDTVDEKLLAAPVKLTQAALYCPRCTAKLLEFKDPLLPQEIQLRRCQRCEGIWLNRGGFSRYKGHQKKIRQEKMGSAEVIRKIPEVYRDPKAWVVTGTKGMFAYPQGIANDKGPTEDTIGGNFKLILETLVRMVLGV